MAPVSNIPTSVVRTQSILFFSLFGTLLVSFLSVMGKQWVRRYTRASTRGNIANRGEERQAKFLGLQKWRFRLIMELLTVILQVDLNLFAIALIVYLWDLDVTISGMVLTVLVVGNTIYGFLTVAAIVWKDFPFPTHLADLLPMVPGWTREFTALARIRLRRWLRRKATTPLSRVEQLKEHTPLPNHLSRVFKTPGGTTSLALPGEDIPNTDYPMTLSNPAFWRQDPLFNPPIQEDIRASAGFWLLENSTDFSAATAVAAAFSEFQWPSHHPSSTALIRLRDAYIECFREPETKDPTRIKALQSAAAYYVIYHTQFIWNTWKGLEVEVEKLPTNLPPDLLHQYKDKWDGHDIFEYLLRVDPNDRSEPVKSTRFLSYIAPYWFCGDSEDSIRLRSDRLQILSELIDVLDKSKALTSATLTDCILCAGAAMDFPLHPEDLIRVDKRCVPFSSCVGGRSNWGSAIILNRRSGRWLNMSV